jgi:hypothetical protein
VSRDAVVRGVPGPTAFGSDIQPEQQWQRKPARPAHRQWHPERQHHPDMPEAAKRLAGARQQRVVVHRRQADPLARLAGERVVDQDGQRLVGRDPRQRQPEHHLAHGIQAPGRPTEEPMEHRDVAALHPARRHGHRRDRPSPQTMDPAGHQQPKRPIARRREARLERHEQPDERAR